MVQKSLNTFEYFCFLCFSCCIAIFLNKKCHVKMAFLYRYIYVLKKALKSQSNILVSADNRLTVGFCLPFSILDNEYTEISTPISWSLASIFACVKLLFSLNDFIFFPMFISSTCMIQISFFMLNLANLNFILFILFILY